MRSQWHPGEQEMHRLLRVPYEDNPTVPGLPTAYALWMAQSPLVALGTVDRDDRVWTTVLGGAAGVVRPVANGVLGLSSATLPFDPVLDALLSGDHGERGKPVSGLAIDLEHRMRVKLAGRVVDGVVRENAHLTVAVDEALGNCPKYLNRKVVRPHAASPRLVGDRLPLGPEAVDLIGRADIFFLSSRHGAESMDTNNRGGAPGFVRVAGNSEDEGVTLVYPEYSGNRLYQTLGNLTSDPAVGITFPDFETGDVLYLTGRAEILIGDEAASVLPHSTMAVRVEVDAARFVRDGLPFRGRALDPSPYNPPVRRLARELTGSEASPVGTSRIATATLVRAHPVTPTISRYTFRLSPDVEPWRAGQHVTMDFSAQLDRGWSHMRDHDPRSLNDDHVRSFTISSAPGGAEFDITVRRNGPVTGLLARWRPGQVLTVDVLGFAGDDDLRSADDVVVVAAGVGITPLVAQARPALESGQRLHVLWSLRADDLPLAADVLGQIDGLGAVTDLFVTGPVGADLQDLTRFGAEVHARRMTEADVLGAGEAGRRRFHVCTGRGMRESVLEWVGGEPVRTESFDY